MYNLSESAIPAIAGDVKNAFAATDAPLSLHANMLSTVIEAIRTSNIPVNASQRAYDDMVGAMTSLLDARKRAGHSLTTMTAIGRQSIHREKMDGCPGGWPTSAAPADINVLS